MKKAIFIFLLIFILFCPKKISSLKQEKYQQTDIIGYIEIPNTDINTPIVQSSDNVFYLDHNIQKQQDIKGSIFLDYRNNLSDQKLLIYGHNSKNGDAPLKTLENYLDKNYYDDHPFIKLMIDDKTYDYKIFSIIVTNTNVHTKINFKAEEYIAHLNWLKNHSIYQINIPVYNNDFIITIQTCIFDPENHYLIISAKRS